MNQVFTKQPGQLLSIGQVTALTGVGKSTLRHWEHEFCDFLTSVRTEGNQRRFTTDSVEKIEKIRGLVEDQGLTLRGVRKRLETELRTDKEGEAEEPKLAPDDRLKQFADLMTDHIVRRLFREG